MSFLDFLFGNTAPAKQPIQLPGADPTMNPMSGEGSSAISVAKPLVKIQPAAKPITKISTPAAPAISSGTPTVQKFATPDGGSTTVTKTPLTQNTNLADHLMPSLPKFQNTQIKSAAPVVAAEAKGDILGGIVDPKIAETGNPAVISEAAAAEGLKILHSEFATPQETGLPPALQEPLHKLFSFEQGGASAAGDTIQGAMRLFGIQNKGTQAVTPQQKMDNIYKYLDKYNPALAINLRAQEALSDRSPVSETIGAGAESFAEAGLVSEASAKILSAIPAFNALEAGSHGVEGMHAANAIRNAISGVAAIATHGGTRGESTKEIAKSIMSSPSILFAHTSIPALGFGALADSFAGYMTGMSPTENFLHSALNLGGNAMGYVAGQEAVSNFETDMSKVKLNFRLSDDFENLPQSLKDEVFDSAQRAYSYAKGNPEDIAGNSKVYEQEGKRLQKLFKEYQKTSPTAENRMIGLTGPEQTGEPRLPPKSLPATPTEAEAINTQIENVQKEIYEHQQSIEHYQQMISENPVAGLRKSVGRKEGELPSEGGKSAFAQTEDQLAVKLAGEHGQLGITNEAGQADNGLMRDRFDTVREYVDKLKDEKRQLANKKIELSHLQKAAQAPDGVSQGGFKKMAKNAAKINDRGEVHPSLVNEGNAPVRPLGKAPIAEPDLSPAEQASIQRFEESLSPEDKQALQEGKPMDRTLALGHIREARAAMEKMPDGPAKEMQKEAIKAMQKKMETYGQQQHRLLGSAMKALKSETKEKVLANKRADAHEMNRLQKDITTLKRQALRMPIDTQKQMLDIAKNHREDASLEELRVMKETLTHLHAQGAVKNQMRIEEREQKIAEMRSKLIEGVKPRKISESPADSVTQLRLKNMQPDVMLDSMGPNVWKMTKGRYEEQSIKAMKDARQWIAEHNAIVKKYQLTPQEYLRIDMFAKDQRLNNAGRLDAMGYQVPTLTDKEFAAYQELQKHMTSVAWDKMLAIHDALNPTEILKQDPNYWISPTLRDPNSLAPKIIRNDASVQDSFAHNTIGGQDVALSMDPIHDIPKGFMAMARYVHTAQALNEMHKMIDDPRIVRALGKMNAEALDYWMRKTANGRNMAQDMSDITKKLSAELGRRVTQSFMTLNTKASGKHLSLLPASLIETAKGTSAATAGKAALQIIRNVPNALVPKLNYGGIQEYLTDINPELGQKLGNIEQYMKPKELPRIRDQKGLGKKVTMALLRRPMDWFPQWVQTISRYPIAVADRLQQVGPAMMMHDYFTNKGMTSEEAVVQTNKVLRHIFPGYGPKDQPAIMDEPLAKPFQFMQSGNMGRASSVRSNVSEVFNKNTSARNRAYAALSLMSFYIGTLIVNYLDTLGIPDPETRKQAQADILSPKGLAIAALETPFVSARVIYNTFEFMKYGTESTGAAVLDVIASLARSSYYAVTGKTDATIDRNKFKAAESIGELYGAPKRVMDLFKPDTTGSAPPTDPFSELPDLGTGTTPDLPTANNSDPYSGLPTIQ